MADDPGVPLAHYLQHQGCCVRFICRHCQRSSDVEVARVVQRLQALGLGGPHTGVRALARLARRACPRCGSLRWETRPAFPPGGARP